MPSQSRLPPKNPSSLFLLLIFIYISCPGCAPSHRGSVGKKGKGRDAVQALKSLCFVSTVSASNPKPGTVRVTAEKNLHPNQSRYDADRASLLPEVLVDFLILVLIFPEPGEPLEFWDVSKGFVDGEIFCQQLLQEGPREAKPSSLIFVFSATYTEPQLRQGGVGRQRESIGDTA